ncbi:DNA translocase FtsK [Bacillus manliponensis]|uniref:DNA translocase FtsK n=1 Tax=Bacillus manliponensis TaxID=574376 RepID=UPI003515B15C
MLDWMKKLFKAEEEKKQTAVTETEKSVETNVTSQTSRTNYYSNKRDNTGLQTLKSRTNGNFRFPLIPDQGLEEQIPQSPRLEQEEIEQVLVREKRQALREEVVPESPRLVKQPKLVQKESPVVNKTMQAPIASEEESKRRPFRPTEVVSPIFGYKRPEREEKKEVPVVEQVEQEDIFISTEGKSVVDAWLEKNGYVTKEESEAVPQTPVVDAWLEKHGYIENDVSAYETVNEAESNKEPSATAAEMKVTPVREEHIMKQKEDVTIQEEITSEAFVDYEEKNIQVEELEVFVEAEVEGVEEKQEEPEVLMEVKVAEESQEEPEVFVELEAEVAEESQEAVEVSVELEAEVVEEKQEEPEVFVEAEAEVVEEKQEEPEVFVEAEAEVVEEKQEEPEVFVELEAEVAEESQGEPEVFVELEAEVAEESQEAVEVSVEPQAEVVEEKQEEPEVFVELEAEVVEEKQEEPEVFVGLEAEVVEEEPKEPEVFVELEAEVVEEEPKEPGIFVESVQQYVHAEDVKKNEVEQKEEDVAIHAQPEAKKEQQVKIEEQKREKKRFVPFNVVMLKQDKRKLEEKRRAELMQAAVEQRVQEQVQEPKQEQVQEPKQEQVQEPMQEQVQEPVQEQVQKPVQEQVQKPVQEQVQEPVQEQVQEPMQEQVQKPVQEQVQEPVQEQVQKPVQEEPSFTHRVEPTAKQITHDVRNVLQTPPTYEFPPITLLNIPERKETDNEEWLEEQKELLNTTFRNFHVGANVVNVTQGPAVTRFEVQPEPGVKVNKITNLSDDIKLNLAARDIRIEAPIPGKNAVGIEVPNKESKAVYLREILRSPVFCKSESPLTVALGLDISGTPIVTDIRKMPHGLIAGSTGSGKSVCINAILTSILYKAKPHEVKLMLIDPKMVELAPYNSIPHLVAPVITDAKAATAALKWAVDEMERRYELFAHAGARDLTRYNTIMNEQEIKGETLPYIVIVVDELADLMMVAPGDVEEAICRIAQKARACGIHLLVATQRPSVDVITGLIKSNIPTRIAFTVSSQVDSRTIIDIGGAEKLLGRGDMLFLDNGTSKPVRVQGVYVSDEEIERSVAHAKRQMKPNYLFKQEDLLTKAEQHETEDELFYDACQFVVEQGGASTSSVQRRFRIGYNRAARLIEEMEAQGIISEARGTKPRDVLITEDEFAAMQDTNV